MTKAIDTALPGRAAEVPVHSNRKQIAATTLLAMDMPEGNWTVKVRHQPPGTAVSPSVLALVRR
ncbi:MAG: hypothetical protein QOK02_751 [Mycobacterium sp.]|nr:hypothetical protein [Mycobacterium sp.]